MGSGHERVDLVVHRIESYRMGTLFGLHSLHKPHGPSVEDLDDARVSD